MNCPGCGRDHIEANLGFMALPNDRCGWPPCEGCGFPSFESLYGIIVPPPRSGAEDAFDENGFLLPDGPMTFRTPGIYR